MGRADRDVSSPTEMLTSISLVFALEVQIPPRPTLPFNVDISSTAAPNLTQMFGPRT